MSYSAQGNPLEPSRAAPGPLAGSFSKLTGTHLPPRPRPSIPGNGRLRSPAGKPIGRAAHERYPGEFSFTDRDDPCRTMERGRHS